MILGIAIGFGDAELTWRRYVRACEHLNIQYRLVSIINFDWQSQIWEVKNIISGLLVAPPCQNIEEYDIYLERLYFIVNELKIPIYPSYNELKLYENKRYCTAWLEHYGYSMPKTYVITSKQEAYKFIKELRYPMVIKATIGAGASAVQIVKNIRRAKIITRKVFGFHRLLSMGYISWVKYKNTVIRIPLIGSSMRHYMIIQEYIPIKWEWRIIKINKSYFGHQKLLKGLYASGSDKVGWVDPPRELLDLIRNVCEKGKFFSMAMDVFESIDGKFYINELQSVFGSYNDSQMYINGKPGRYLYQEGKYHFQEGFFNLYGSNLLRVEHFLELLGRKTSE